MLTVMDGQQTTMPSPMTELNGMIPTAMDSVTNRLETMLMIARQHLEIHGRMEL